MFGFAAIILTTAAAFASTPKRADVFACSEPPLFSTQNHPWTLPANLSSSTVAERRSGPAIPSYGLAAQISEPIRGFADLHVHQFANLGFGGVLVQGSPISTRGDIDQALRRCDFLLVGDRDPLSQELLFVVDQFGLPAATIPTAPFFPFTPSWPIHGAFGVENWVETSLGGGVGHNVHGFQSFEGWPSWHTHTHQQAFIDWVHRAFQGGMKLMVMLAVNNDVLCHVQHRRLAGYGCDDMIAAQRQILAAKQLEAYIDGLSGGDGWYKIAYSAAQAREIIDGGKLAVVLGLEVSGLFDCHRGRCDEDLVRSAVQRWYDLGVRHVFPVHEFDNDFGGTSHWNEFFNLGTKLTDGGWFVPESCPEPSSGIPYGFELRFPDAPIGLGIGALMAFVLSDPLAGIVTAAAYGEAIGPPPSYGPGPHCNSIGVKPLGRFLIQELMQKGMIIDLDHFSRKGALDALDFTQKMHYPGVVLGHAEMLESSIGEVRSEMRRSPEELERVRALGGLVGLIPHNNRIAETLTYTSQRTGTAVSNDCGNSTKTFAQTYLYAVDRMAGGAIAFGSDFTGFAAHFAPRFGADACAGDGLPQDPTTSVEYPFSVIGGGTLDRMVVGDKTFDYNTDGLANIGLYPDAIRDLQKIGLTKEDLDPLFRSAEAYVAMWERAECGPDIDDDGAGNNCDADDDGDGLSDKVEELLGTDPLRADTDADGLTDGLEVSVGTNATDVDSDDDGVADGEDLDWLESVISGLPPDVLRNPGENRTAMLNILEGIEAAVATGSPETAIQRLLNLRQRVDGCGSTADPNDWILACPTQVLIRGYIDLLIANLGT